MHDPKHHFALRQAVRNVAVVRMSATMDNAVHVEVQMIKLWEKSIIADNLIDFGIALRDPAVKLEQSM